MRNTNRKKSKKLRIIKIISFIFIGAGILFLLYPSYTNFIAERKETNILSTWEAQKKTFAEEEKKSTGLVGNSKVTSKDILGEEENNEKDNEIIEESEDLSINAGNNIDEEIINYENLTAEDFFPLKISIPKIELEWIAYEGTDRETLKKGPGHETLTPLPGDIGRCTISGHRTTYGAPFSKIDELKNGDLIYLETIKDEVFTFVVTGQEIVNPEDVYILDGSGKRELLLTSCEPKFSAAKRLVIIAELIKIYPIELEFKR